MVKAKKVAGKKKKSRSIELFTDQHTLLMSMINKEAKELKVKPIGFDVPEGRRGAIPTGSLCFDLITGGGFPRHRMTTVAGLSGVGKSTLIQSAFGPQLAMGVFNQYGDLEGGADYEWMMKNGADVNQYIHDDAKLFYYIPDFDSGEDAFRYITRIQENVIGLAEKGKIQIPEDRHTNIFYFDSIPAAVPEALLENDEAGNSPMVAQMMSKWLPMVRSKLRKSNSAFIAVNQIRTNPRAKFGNPEYEPGGSAPTFYADMKVLLKATTKPKDLWDGKKPHQIVPTDPNCFKEGGINIEKNPDGTEDRYKYTHVKTTKNRVFSPLKETFIRIWLEDKDGQARGFDPVWDTLRFYEEIGLLVFGKKKEGDVEVLFRGEETTYHTLKQQILADPTLRNEALAMLDSGDAWKLYANRMAGTDESVEDEDGVETEFHEGMLAQDSDEDSGLELADRPE